LFASESTYARKFIFLLASARKLCFHSLIKGANPMEHKLDMLSGAVLGGAAYAGEPVAIKLVEPPVIEMPVIGALSIWHFPDDGSLVIRKGAGFASADTLCVEPHEITSLWTTLKAIDEAGR
jgi:hypothetical protein